MNRFVIALLGAVLGVAGCAAPAPQKPTPGISFTENGVTVTVSLMDWTGTSGTVRTTFRPDRAGFHLYSVRLPADGIDGIGRPTSVHVEGAFTATGPLTADAPSTDLTLPELGLTLPVYPDGPITTTLPVRASAQGTATILIGYAACSQTEGCLVPVTDHAVSVTVSELQAILDR